jgi:hypothetical protein
VILPVFIDLPPNVDRSSASVAALVEGCAATSSGRTCLVNPSSDATYDLVVTFAFNDAEQRVAELQLRRGSRAAPVWRTEWVEFRPTDDRRERWRALGLIIGTLAAGNTEHPEEGAPALAPMVTQDAPSALRLPPPVERGNRKSRWNLYLDGGLVAGPGLDASTPSLGLFGRASFAPWSLPVGMTAAYRQERQWATSDFGLDLGSASLGAFARVELGQAAGIEARAEVVRRFVILSADDTASGTTETHYRWQTGFRVGFDLDLRFATRFSFLAGADAVVLDQTTVVRVQNAIKGDIPAFYIDGRLGIRFTLDPKS